MIANFHYDCRLSGQFGYLDSIEYAPELLESQARVSG